MWGEGRVVITHLGEAGACICNPSFQTCLSPATCTKPFILLCYLFSSAQLATDGFPPSQRMNCSLGTNTHLKPVELALGSTTAPPIWATGTRYGFCHPPCPASPILPSVLHPSPAQAHSCIPVPLRPCINWLGSPCPRPIHSKGQG